MNGVTTALVAFLFVGIIFPALIKSKTQYYAAFGLVLFIILLGFLAAIASPSFRTFCLFLIAVSQIGAMVLLLMSAGGLSAREFAGEVTHAIEVIRRGETEKEVIVPLSGQLSPQGKPTVYRDPPATHEPEGHVYVINENPPPAQQAKPAAPPAGPIPLE